MKPIVYIILIILISLVMGAIALTAPHECGAEKKGFIVQYVQERQNHGCRNKDV